MSRVIEEIRRKLSRVFLGRIIVRELSELRRVSPPGISTYRRGVDVIPMRLEPRVECALFVEWKNTVAKNAGSLINLDFKSLKVSQVVLETAKIPEIKKYKLNIKRRASARQAIARINRAPLQRRNRINFLKNPPKMENAKLLAIYSPIYQEKVAKSVLDKSSGNLLFWYDNKRVKLGERYHLLLLRVFGGEEPLKWMWLPADSDKKIG